MFFTWLPDRDSVTNNFAKQNFRDLDSAIPDLPQVTDTGALSLRFSRPLNQLK